MIQTHACMNGETSNRFFGSQPDPFRTCCYLRMGVGFFRQLSFVHCMILKLEWWTKLLYTFMSSLFYLLQCVLAPASPLFCSFAPSFLQAPIRPLPGHIHCSFSSNSGSKTALEGLATVHPISRAPVHNCSFFVSKKKKVDHWLSYF